MKSSDFFDAHMNANQRKAVVSVEGPVLMIAGPGTGKTYTLVKRIAYLVVEQKVSPGEIMAVTFTQKAAKELLTRISNEFFKYDIYVNLNDMYIGTFHSVCLRLLKEYGGSQEQKQGRILDAFEQNYLVCRNLDIFRFLRGYSEHITGKNPWNQAMEICRYVNLMMEEMVDIEAMEKDADEDMRFLARLVVRYRELLQRNSCLDFSSIQSTTYEMLTQNKDILNRRVYFFCGV